MPARFRNIKRALESIGLQVVEADGTSHWKIMDAAGKMYPIPLHNGLKTEVSDVYLRGICRAFGIDWATLKKLL